MGGFFKVVGNIFMYNPIVSVGFLSFLLAQILKTFHYAIKFRTFNKERIYGAGGMPSSHSSLVASVVMYLGRTKGPDSVEFALAVLVAGITIFDALSVRYNAGLHAKELNRLRRVIDELDDEVSQLSGSEESPAVDEIVDRKDFKEFLGHTPIEVIAGALLGIIMGLIFPKPV